MTNTEPKLQQIYGFLFLKSNTQIISRQPSLIDSNEFEKIFIPELEQHSNPKSPEIISQNVLDANVNTAVSYQNIKDNGLSPYKVL